MTALFARLTPAAAFLLLAAAADAPVKIAWNFKEGERFFVEEKNNARQTIKIMDLETAQNVEETKVSRFAVLKKNKDGGVVLEQLIQSVKVKHVGEGPDVDTRILQQLEGTRFEISLSTDGKVTALAGYDTLLKKIARDDPVRIKLVRGLMTKDSFKSGLEQLLGFAPGKAVAKGAVWQRQSRLPLGPLGTLKLESEYTLEDVDPASMIARLAVTSKADYVPPGDGLDTLKVTGGDLRLLRSSGTLRFDVAHGRLASSEIKSEIEGTLRVTLRDAEREMTLQQTQTRGVRVLDRNPLEK